MNSQLSPVHRQDLRSDEEANRYSKRSILRSEFMYGEGFQSPGGVEAVTAFCTRLHLWEGMKILDIGSGLGGAAFYFAERYRANVLGVDSSQVMVELSTERATRRNVTGVTFRQGDIRTVPLTREAFDLAWTRDCMLYIADKSQAWANVYAALKSGGQLFITDFCRGTGPCSESFHTYIEQCGYHLQGLEEYGNTLEAAGFRNLHIEDQTKTFIDSLRQELVEFREKRDAFLQEFTQADFEYLVDRWLKKIRFCEEGHLVWGLFTARK